MYNIEAFNKVLNLEIAVYIAAGLAGVLGIRIRTRGAEDHVRAVSDAWNAMLIWLLVWKGSLLIVDFHSVQANWHALLYYSGGVTGMWLAAIVSCVYLIYRSGVLTGFERALIMFLGWMLVYEISQLIFGSQEVVRPILLLLLSLLPWYWMVRDKERVQTSRLATIGLIYALGFASISFFDLPNGSPSQVTAASETGAKVGQIAASFELKDLEGDTVRLSDYRGRVVLLNFWATWCPPCQVEMPHLEKLSETYNDQQVVVLAVNLTSTERSSQAVGEFIHQKGFTFPVVCDTAGDVQELYRIKGYPTSIFIDRSGAIVERVPGAMDYAGMKKIIEQSLD